MRIDEHASRGKILVATKRLHAGMTILHEKPVIRHRPRLWRTGCQDIYQLSFWTLFIDTQLF